MKTGENNYVKSGGVVSMVNYTIVINISYNNCLMAAYENRNWLLQSRFLFDKHILSAW